jgi:branched-chain amino acid transport system substrate-binding protein
MVAIWRSDASIHLTFKLEIYMTTSEQKDMGRRSFIRHAGALTAAGLPMFHVGSALAQSTLKIGMVIAKQGPFAQQGADLAKGIQIAFEEAGSKVLGRPCELVWLDEATPQGAVQNITKLIEEQKVLAVLGGTNSATSLAMGAVAQRGKTAFISVNGAAREITGKDCNPFMFRSQPSVPVFAHAMAPHMLSLGKRWYFIAGSFAFGEDVISTYSQILQAAGGTVVGVDRTPVATTDYSSFMLKARAAKPDIIVSGAANIEPLLKQLKELNMTGQVQIAGPAVSDTDLWSSSPEALTGIYGKTWFYKDPNNTPQEKAFVQAYLTKEGRPPSDRVYFGWLSMKMVLAACQAANSTDTVAITRALEEVKIPDGQLSIQFRKSDHQLMRRLIVASARKPNPSDKWDVVDIKPATPSDMAGLDRMYGSQAEVGCKMLPIG